MQPSALLPAIASSLAAEIPVILVCLVGCIFIITRWGELGRSAWLALAGLGLGLFVAIVSPIAFAVLTSMFSGPRPPTPAVFMGVRVIFTILWALAFLCLLLAVLARRTPPAAGQ